jgi:hypothetical protein
MHGNCAWTSCQQNEVQQLSAQHSMACACPAAEVAEQGATEFAQQGEFSYLLLLLPEALELRGLLEHNIGYGTSTVVTMPARRSTYVVYCCHPSAKKLPLIHPNLTHRLLLDSVHPVHTGDRLWVFLAFVWCTQAARVHMQLAEQPREALVSDPARTVIAWRRWPSIVRAKSLREGIMYPGMRLVCEYDNWRAPRQAPAHFWRQTLAFKIGDMWDYIICERLHSSPAHQQP